MADQNIQKLITEYEIRTTQFEKALASTSLSANNLAMTFARGFAGGMFAGGVAGIVHGISRINGEMAKLAQVSDMVNVGVEDLQRLRFGFETTGVAADQTDTALRRFARRVGEAANGGGQLYEVLKANNVQLRNSDGSMRRQIDLLRDYANLIQNAGSHQERLSLAFKAFDMAGASMVQALSNGADGLNTLMDKAEEAGGVIDEELVRKAEQMDTEFATLWRNFEMFAKRAIINVSVALRDGLLKDINDIGGALRDLWNDPSLHNVGRVLFGDNFVGTEENAGVRAMERRVEMLTKQVDNLKDLGFDTLEAERELAQARAQLEAEVQRIMAGGGGGEIKLGPINVTATPTIIPGGKDDDSGSKRAGSRNRAAEAALREMQAVNDLIDSLSFELELIGKSDLEKAQANALRRAGSAATDEQRQKIEALVEAIHNETEALRQNEEAQRKRESALQSLFQMGGDALLSIVDGSMKAEDALKRLIIQLALAAAQAALLGSGPLSGLIPSFFAGGGLVKAASGGLIRGPGGPTDDKIPAMLSDGEYVVRARQVQKFGPLIEAINQDRISQYALGGFVAPPIPHFDEGGYVTAMPALPRVNNIRDGASGGASVLRVELSKDLEARILQEAGKQSVQITSNGLSQFSQEVLPHRVNQIAADPYARG